MPTSNKAKKLEALQICNVCKLALLGEKIGKKYLAAQKLDSEELESIPDNSSRLYCSSCLGIFVQVSSFCDYVKAELLKKGVSKPNFNFNVGISSSFMLRKAATEMFLEKELKLVIFSFYSLL
ncbi:hypothetical protein AYI70_g1380 [Smittium culicis]|uniref:Uncharacterized protein n=1 Tax=Smittium culicis TaxID=133412 RepID=A0A1R1YCT6_9FUNG|nr:hypothetical protein AYI70_g1380 [Smittium culicis]